jgi:hypothetical protein
MIFQTPLLEGLTGLLFSPSRGLFIYSPFLLFSVWGAFVSFRESTWRFVRPLILSMTAILGVEACHFDWWSGWSYGYRHIVDLCPYLALCLIPVFNRILDHTLLRLVFRLTFAWSILVQIIGAYAYDFPGWNGRESFLVTDAHGDPPREIQDLSA